MLVSRSKEGTPQSIQDKVPNAVPASDFETPTTVPASSGGEGRPEPGLDSAGANEAVLELRQRPRRRVVGSQLSANRFSAFGDDPKVEDEASSGEESQEHRD